LRGEDSNPGTVCLGLERAWPSPFLACPQAALSSDAFPRLFRRSYLAIRGVLNSHVEPGLGLFVAGSEGLEAWAWAAAKSDDIRTLIVGRHTEADLFLPSDPALSLRHLAVILHPHHGRSPVRFRVVDLRTPTAFADDLGARLEAVEAEGPLVLQCASFAVFAIPAGGSGLAWPEDPEAAWHRIPQRVYLERKHADPDRGWAAGANPVRLDPGEEESPGTLVFTFPGPAFVPHVLSDPEPPQGDIVVRTPTTQVSIPLGVSAAAQGLLLGRYERCDPAGLSLLSDEGLSRVHLLILRVDGALQALDTASRNGSWVGGRQIRSVRLDPGVCLTLADKTTVEWIPRTRLGNALDTPEIGAVT
jgi:hypothetical protein